MVPALMQLTVIGKTQIAFKIHVYLVTIVVTAKKGRYGWVREHKRGDLGPECAQGTLPCEVAHGAQLASSMQQMFPDAYWRARRWSSTCSQTSPNVTLTATLWGGYDHYSDFTDVERKAQRG